MSLFDASFFKRLGFYMFGLSIGIVFIAFFFKKKTEETGTSFCYFPNCRTLKDMRSKPISYAEEINELLSTKALDSTDIISFFTSGDVDFARSDTKSIPCRTYYIEGMVKGGEAVLEVMNCNEKVLVKGLTY
ncbi:MAG: DUF4258 domain-containing protein [Flavobacteriaceae bacterium]